MTSVIDKPSPRVDRWVVKTGHFYYTPYFVEKGDFLLEMSDWVTWQKLAKKYSSREEAKVVSAECPDSRVVRLVRKK